MSVLFWGEADGGGGHGHVSDATNYLKGTELTDPPPVDGHLEILQRPALVELRGACKTQNAGP